MADAWTYADAVREVWRRSSYERGYITNPFGDQRSGERGLDRTRRLLELLGDPDRGRVIAHVAGSKGKGSTATMIAAIGQTAGYRVGLYTSPHLHSFRERIAVDGEPIGEAAFAGLTRWTAAAAARLEATDPELGQVTTFELLTAMALDHFAVTNRDLIVLEVGLGGTYDATNVVIPAVSVITALDLEHTAVLGSTLPEIARAKAGIIKPGVPVVVSPQPAPILVLLTEIAAECQSRLLSAGRDWTWHGSWRDFSVRGPWGTYAGLHSALPGAHQVENAATAVAATWELRAAGLDLPEGAVRAGLAGVRLAGRFERHDARDGRVIILDGAHTPASAKVLAAAVEADYPGRQAIVVIGTSADKDVAAIGRALRPMTRRAIATRSTNPRAASAAQVAAALEQVGIKVDTEPDVASAIAQATAAAGSDDLVLITGSLFVVAEAREALGLGQPDPVPLAS